MALPTLIRRSRPNDQNTLARNDFDTMINRLFGGMMFADDSQNGPLSTLTGYGVDVREDADHIYVEADLPGFNKDEVDISLENGTLTIVAEKKEEIPAPQQDDKQEASGQKGNYLLRERRIQRFIRSFTLPSDVDEQSVQAKLDNGVLKITLNKREESKPKRVKVS